MPSFLDELFEDDDVSTSTKKTRKRQQKLVVFDQNPESASINQHDIQACKNGGMICYGNSYKKILEALIGHTETLFLDFETGSYDRTKDSLNPWRNCWPIGVAFIAETKENKDNYRNAYYIPINKTNEKDVYYLLSQLFTDANLEKWINHNIKYDIHVLYNSCGIDVAALYNVQLIDTVTLAKLIDSDRFRYGLDHLSKDWLEQDISEYEETLKPYKHRNKDYSVIPYDIIGPYACQDVITNRLLYQYIQKNLPEECYFIRDIEIELTRILVEIERNGLRVDPSNLQVTEILNLRKLIQIEQELEGLVGRNFRPHTNADCFEILCNYFGLPVLKWTNGQEKEEYINEDEKEELSLDDGPPCNASFDKHALVAYLSHPVVLSNENIKRTVELIIQYRKINTFNSLFVKTFQELVVGDTLHPSYNQCVRSGRMSCKKPNAQQNDKQAKELIIPYHNQETDADDEIFVSYDQSQIEYRTIAHYIENPELLKAYNENPDADFHQWVADLVKEATGLSGMTRQPAKTLNFGLGFNMGKKKLLKSLKGNMDLMNSLVQELNELIEGGLLTKEDFAHCFNTEAEKRAELVYNAYHSTIPEMKQTSRKAQAICEKRGYIKTLYNRRRHLEYRFAYRAFNTVNQGSAADILKDRMVYIGKILRECNRNSYGEQIIKIVASVHDEVLFSMPRILAEDTRITYTIAYWFENPIFPPYVIENEDGTITYTEKKLLVPIRVSMGTGSTWAEACKSVKDGGNNCVRQYIDSVVSAEEFCSIVNGIYSNG